MPRTRRQSEAESTHSLCSTGDPSGARADIETRLARQHLILKEACGQIGDLRGRVDDLRGTVGEALANGSEWRDKSAKRVEELDLGVSGIGGHLGRLEVKVKALADRMEALERLDAARVGWLQAADSRVNSVISAQSVQNFLVRKRMDAMECRPPWYTRLRRWVSNWWAIVPETPSDYNKTHPMEAFRTTFECKHRDRYRLPDGTCSDCGKHIGKLEVKTPAVEVREVQMPQRVQDAIGRGLEMGPAAAYAKPKGKPPEGGGG